MRVGRKRKWPIDTLDVGEQLTLGPLPHDTILSIASCLRYYRRVTGRRMSRRVKNNVITITRLT